MMPQHHALGQADVECLHPDQPGDTRLGVGQQHVQQIQEVLPRFIWRQEWIGRAILLARAVWLKEESQKAEKGLRYSGLLGTITLRAA